MTQTELLLLQGLIGQVLPPVTDIINKNISSSRVRFLISIAISLAIAILFNLPKILLGNVTEMITTATLLWTSSQAAYKLYYGGSTWQDNIRFSSSPLPLKQLVPPIKK